MCRSVLNGIKKIKQHRVKNANNIIIGHLNINSFRNKFVFAEDIIQVFDIFLVSESKLDNTFPTNLFKINGYTIFRYDLYQFVFICKRAMAMQVTSTTP